MTQVVYYKEGRGVLRLSCLSEPAIDAGVQRAQQLVAAEAVVQRHGALCWQRAAGATFARCARCGHTAVLTWCGERLFVDSCLQHACQPPDPLSSRCPGTRSPDRAAPLATLWRRLCGRVPRAGLAVTRV